MTTLDLDNIATADQLATSIASKWESWDSLRSRWFDEVAEIEKYTYATDTEEIGGRTLPWNNKINLPKTTHIRDNLVTNYLSALFSSDDWLQWDGKSEDDERKAEVIKAYMKQKLREKNFETLCADLLDDFVIYGNVFAYSEYENETYFDAFGDRVVEYTGPIAKRISPYDIVFDPTAADFERTPKIVRKVVSLGDLAARLDDNPNETWIQDLLSDTMSIRSHVGTMSRGDQIKDDNYGMAGFSTRQAYYSSDKVELLEFHGDIFDPINNKFKKNKIITVYDRRRIAQEIDNPSWTGKSRIKHVGWRTRPDNLWAQSPLAGIIGMQYRVNHLTNLMADAYDQLAYPVQKIKGEVDDDFTGAPGSRIYVGEDGDVDYMRVPSEFLTARTDVENLMNMMEKFAGAPEVALGTRLPGERTAAEYQGMSNAASRIFQSKISYFEEKFLLPILNDMLANARRKMNDTDILRSLDPELGYTVFTEITREDLSAKGTLRPVGSRHNVRRNQLYQNLMGLANSAIYQDQGVNVHISGLKMAKIAEDLLELKSMELVQENIRVSEQLSTQQATTAAQQGLEEEIVQSQAVQQETADMDAQIAAMEVQEEMI